MIVVEITVRNRVRVAVGLQVAMGLYPERTWSGSGRQRSYRSVQGGNPRSKLKKRK